MVGENNKVVIVTGGSSGIGRHTASALKENGCIVYEFSRRSIPMEGVTHLSVDVTDEDAVNAAVQQVIQKRPKLMLWSTVQALAFPVRWSLPPWSKPKHSLT